jgi:hypothetical protein
MTKEPRLVKYLKGTSDAMRVLATEIARDGYTTEHKELLKEMASKTLFFAIAKDYQH